jgi:regulator of RNase E activity RraA
VRDVAGLGEIRLVCARWPARRGAATSAGNGACDLPLHFAGVGFRPGAYLYADEDGIWSRRATCSPEPE